MLDTKTDKVQTDKFRARIEADLEAALARTAGQLPSQNPEDLLRIDLHCHDRNSDVPDETIGRLLRTPETWLETKDLVRTLRKHGSDAITITNHNNARSSWELRDRGEDVLSAAEFSCTLPQPRLGVHVLTFGFTPAEEAKLKVLRKDIYKFLAYTSERDIPTVLAHPLHFYMPGGVPDQSIMDRFALLFERFEGINGQRDSWQNLLTMEWIKTLDEERLTTLGKQLGIAPGEFCREPFAKRITGGSDCHFGIFAGATGTSIYAPGWRQSGKKPSEIALEGLRNGPIAPFGMLCSEEKLTAAFLAYFSQIALRIEDAGLIRLLLHKGTAGEKLTAFLIGNGLMELRRHKYTSRFLKTFGQALEGKRPGWMLKMATSADYQPVLADIDSIAQARQHSPQKMVETLRDKLPVMFGRMQTLLLNRAGGKFKPFVEKQAAGSLTFADMLERIEVPLHFRSWASGQKRGGKSETDMSIGKLTDGLPFPALAAAVLGGTTFAAHSVLTDRRPFVDAFAARLGRARAPKRILWLTDTFNDKNGVSHVLQATLAEVRRRNLPVDFLACGIPESKTGDHLFTLPALAEFSIPFYPDQPFRIPDLLQVQRLFQEGGYDRIMCSTEAPMGFIALYLQKAFHVPAYFYLHTDWMDFAKRSLSLDSHQLDRLRRFMRAFYRNFDGIFLLNTEQRDMFASPDFGFAPDRLHLTAHWTSTQFKPRKPSRREIFPGLPQGAKVLLFAGRVAAEKGVRELPATLAKIRERVPNAVLAFAGTGPLSEEMKRELPDAYHFGWLPPEKLAEVYAASDLLLLPSWFDTFSCVVLEAMACGLPVVAYNTKGPRDLVLNGVCGYHADSQDHMAQLAADYLLQPNLAATFRRAAVERAAQFEAEPILNKLLLNTGVLDAMKEEEAKPIREQAELVVQENGFSLIDPSLEDF